MFIIKLPFLPIRLVFALIRTIGFGRLIGIGIGIAIGMLIAPTSGAELRAQLQDRLQGGGEPTLAPT